MNRLFSGIPLLLLCWWMAVSVAAGQEPPPTAQETASGERAAKVVVIPVRAQIAKPELYVLRRGLKEAMEQKVDAIVLDMETPGGALDVTFEMLKALEKFPGKTITYVNREAISAGALLSAGTDEIYFAPQGVIGAAAPVLAGGGEIDATMRAKLVSYLKARVRALTEEQEYRGKVISAMMDLDEEFKIGEEVIKEKGQLLSLTAQEAMKEYGDPPRPLLGAGIADSLEGLLDGIYGAGNYTLTRLEVTWSEKTAQYLVLIAPVLMGLGMLLLFIEFKTPGFGFFGIAGGVLMALVFFGHFIAGLSGHEPLLFFLLGVVLVLVELLLLPGTVVFALSGIVLMLGSLVWSMADLWPDEPFSFSPEIFVGPLVNAALGVVFAVVAFLLLLRFLPGGGLWGRMVLHTAVAGGPAGIPGLDSPGAGDAGGLVGAEGVAVTALFPSGQVEIGGRRYEARLAMGFAEAGTPVRIVRQGEFGLEVEVM